MNSEGIVCLILKSRNFCVRVLMYECQFALAVCVCVRCYSLSIENQGRHHYPGEGTDKSQPGNCGRRGDWRKD